MEGVVVVDHFLTPSECDLLLNEAKDWHPAPVGEGEVDEEVRKCDRCMVDSPEWARKLLDRVPPQLGAAGVNPRLRLLRYQPGGFFAPHLDGEFRMGGLVSKWTLQVYLADLHEAQGGGTTFIRFDGPDFTVLPKKGRALLFDQLLLHAGDPVKPGPDVKLVMRTDLMFME